MDHNKENKLKKYRKNIDDETFCSWLIKKRNNKITDEKIKESCGFSRQTINSVFTNQKASEPVFNKLNEFFNEYE